MTFKFPLATTTWDSAERAAIERVVKSDRFTMGPEVLAFEQRFASYHGTKHAVMVNSGSSANLLMTAALFYTNERNSLKPGDEVIVPAVSWATTYAPLAQYGLHLKFVDVDLETLNYDLTALERAVTKKTKLLMIVNLLGNPNDFDVITRIGNHYNLTVIEDNCESLGARFGGKYAGTFGVMGSFSTFFSHHISTMEGGIVVTDDDELEQILRCLRAHGWTRSLPRKNKITGVKSEHSFDESYKFVLPGYNLRPLELSGAIGTEQLIKLPSLLEGRRSNGRKFQIALNDHPDIAIQRELGESSWFGFSLIIRRNSTLQRSELIRKLESAGFECRPIVSGNFLRNKVVDFYSYSCEGEVPNAEYLHENGLFIGNHHYDIGDAVDTLKSVL